MYTKAMALLGITNGITLIVLSPSSKVFIVSICLVDRNVFARFDKILLIALKILRKLSIQKPFRITKGNNSKSIGPLLLCFYYKYLS